MIRFRIPNIVIFPIGGLLTVGFLTEGIMMLSKPESMNIVRETNNIIVVEEVRNHGLNVSEPITLYKIPAECRSPEQTVCYRLSNEDGTVYEEYSIVFNQLDLRDSIIHNRQEVNRIRRERNQLSGQ